MYFRSDMAAEAHDRFMREYSKDHKGEPDGIEYAERRVHGIDISTVRILDGNGEKLLGRPVGTYVTVFLGKVKKASADRADKAAEVISDILAQLGAGRSVLVAGLGNAKITADSVGPVAASHVIATHHIKDAELRKKSGLGDVSVLIPGVLAQSGIDCAALIRAAVAETSASAVIVIDALAAHSPGTLCGTVQITDTGIRPGSGVGNDRGELSRKTLGVKVIAVGVPTVIDAAALLPDECGGDAADSLKGLYVCPKDCGEASEEIGRLIGHAVDRLCHPSLSFSDMEYI